MSVLAHAARLTDALPRLHQHALEVTGGDCALLFERNPRNAVLQATSGYGVSELRTDPWLPSEAEHAIVSATFERQVPTFVSQLDRQMPDLAERLGVPAALLVPLSRGPESKGLLVVGFREAPPADATGEGTAEVADAFLATLTLFRLKQNEELQQDIRELLGEFSAGLSGASNLTGGLDRLCQGANRLFGADRTSVWIHDRKARHLLLQATSETGYSRGSVTVASDDPDAPAASALRRARAELLPLSQDPDLSTATVTVPLRGRRRALGTIVFEGVRAEVGGELDLLDRADELGRQLASAVENMQLLDDVMRSRRELENIFDSIADLVAVADRAGRIVHANAAFAARIQVRRADLLDRPLAGCVGPELGGWLSGLADDTDAEGAAPAVREFMDPVLNGTFAVSVTSLLDEQGSFVGRVLVAHHRTGARAPNSGDDPR